MLGSSPVRQLEMVMALYSWTWAVIVRQASFSEWYWLLHAVLSFRLGGVSGAPLRLVIRSVA